MTLLSLITFNNPSNLAALAVLLIPIIIHLINPNKTQLIWVASIELLKTSKIKRVFQIKLMEKLLLLVRLILFILLTLLLIEPIFLKEAHLKEEAHHYFSLDWLENTSSLERQSILKNLDGEHKYFILEDQKNNDLLTIEQLEKRFRLVSEENNGRSSNQSGYIFELANRMETPTVTHLYVTNRSSNYNYESSGSSMHSAENLLRVNNASIVTHIKKLTPGVQPEKINIDLVYKGEINRKNSQLIEYAVKTIAKNSSDSLVIESYSFDANNKNSHADLVFAFGDFDLLPIVRNENTNVINVKNVDKIWSFESADGTVERWREKRPMALVELLYGLVSRQDKIASRLLIDESKIKQWLDKDSNPSVENSNKPKLATLLEKYLIFLFCLFLLLERWLTFKRVKSNA